VDVGVGFRTEAEGRAEEEVLTGGWRKWFRRTPRDQRARILEDEGRWGWLFTAPALIGIIIFLVLPIFFTVYVSFTNWNGLVPPWAAERVGFENYRELLIQPGVRQTDFAISLRNNLYFVLGVVPTQTFLAFVLAVIVNQKFLKGRGFFRTSYYFPSITSSIAVSFIFIFLFQVNGLVNALLPFANINWLNNASGLIHLTLGALGVDQPPGWMASTEFMGLSLWDWLSGPSVTMFSIMILVIWTTIGTMMLIFLAGLQSISPSLEEAAAVDGATGVQRFWRITVPLMRPTIFFVLTLGVIGTWQVFDQIFAISFGGPQKTTLTPAFLIYFQFTRNFWPGGAAAIAVVLFFIIMLFTLVQRRITREER
jgi:multiple sugar transport system permease protein